MKLEIINSHSFFNKLKSFNDLELAKTVYPFFTKAIEEALPIPLEAPVIQHDCKILNL